MNRKETNKVKRLFGLLGILLVVGVGVSAAVRTPAGRAVAADDTDVAMLVRYIGTASGGGEVAVAAGGDITFTEATVAENDFECPVSGALGGVIDVSDTACDTLGEVCDVINGTGAGSTNWRCVLLDGHRADSSNDTLLTISATTADALDGLGLKFDTDVMKATSVAMVPLKARRMPFYLVGGGSGANEKLVRSPFKNTQTAVTFIYAVAGTATGADTIEILELEGYSPGTKAETLSTYFSVAGGTAGVATTKDFTNAPQLSNLGSKFIVRYKAATTYASGQLTANGYQDTQ